MLDLTQQDQDFIIFKKQKARILFESVKKDNNEIKGYNQSQI